MKTKTKPKLHPVTENRKGERHHFFLSSVATWKTGYDLGSLIASLKLEGYPFNIFLVPGPNNSSYRIENYAPQVEGTVWIGFYGQNAMAVDLPAPALA